MSIRSRVTAVLCVVALASVGCAVETKEPRAEAPTPTVSPSPESESKAAVEDLGAYAPPGFEEGALGVWTKKAKVDLWARPDESSRQKKLSMMNPIQQRLILLVMAARRDADGKGWYKVMLPERPNGSTGWVRSEGLKPVSLDDRIEIDLSRYELKRFVKGKLKHRFDVGIGQDQYPTPTGIFYVWARVPQKDPAGPYGTFALGLSGFSPVLSDWPGGGRSAIHGTADPSDKSAKVSHGCIRVYNADMRKLQDVLMGSPVIIKQ